MEISSIGENAEDRQTYTLLVGDQIDSVFLKMHLEIYARNFKMVLNF